MEYKVGIDFHGVICTAPELFAEFSREIRRLGIGVYVISGGPEEDIRQFMAEKGIEYDVIWTILDFYSAQGKAYYFDDGSFQVPTELWNRAKAEYCAREGIRFHIDDSSVYGKYFVTPYCKYHMDADECSLSDGLKIDFKNPSEAARLVAALIKRN